MKKAMLNRRTFIRSGSTVLALPLLEAMMPQAFGQTANADPKRFVSFYLANGTYMHNNNGAFWQPRGGSAPLTAANLPAVFQPFAANTSDFSIIRGVWNSAKMMADDGAGGITNNHPGAMASFLTNVPIVNWKSERCGIVGSSFDIEIATRNNWRAYALSAGGIDFPIGDTKYPYHLTASYRNNAIVNEIWLNPYKLFTSQGLFMSAAGAPTPTTPLNRNRSILDGAVAAIQSLRNKVGAADRQRLDDYFTSLRSIEASLANSGGGGPATCNPLNPVPTSLDNEDRTSWGGASSRLDYADRIRAFCQVMALAFKCNRAQVFSFAFEHEGVDRNYRGLVPNNLLYQGENLCNTEDSHNGLAHWDFNLHKYSEERLRNALVGRDRFFVSFAMYLVNLLKEAKDPSGSPILDNTIIELGHGMMEGSHVHDNWGEGGGPEGVIRMQKQHNPQGMPLMLAGGRNLIRPGNFHVLDADMKDLHYSIAVAMKAGLTNWRGSSRLVNI